MTAHELGEYLMHFQARVLQDALSEASGAYWSRRAEAFEAAKPAPGEFHGKATRAELSARWCLMDKTARACRARASVSLIPSEVEPDVLTAVWEVS
ncbi:hypothetical protein [uncultured Nocardioides sp.]|uniref:hypothetical protein n=1 Tax=uncultured Nocardioides sp. TaxID=198441 RepID=UPI0030F800D4